MRHLRKRSIGRSFCGVTLLLVAMLIASAGSAVAVDKVKVAYIPVISFSPMFIAIEKGYMKEVNQEWEMLRLGGGSNSIHSLATNEIQVASGSASVGFFNAISQGAAVKVVSDKGLITKQFNYTPMVVRKALYDSGKVRSAKDLVGYRIGQFGKGAISDYLLWKLVEPFGIKYLSLDLLPIFAPPKQYTALQANAVAAVMTVEPWAKRMELEGIGVILPGQTDWVKDGVFQIAVNMFGDKFIQEHRDVAQRWTNAYLKGMQFHNKYGLKNPEIVKIISKWTKVKPEMIMKAVPPVFSKDGHVDVKSMDDVQHWYKEIGWLKKFVPSDKYVDNSFVNRAKY